ncbi:peptidase domain-containing ABC transporter [Microcoleus sp. FACHB-831]|jgi:ATP-binding cassette subfamily B protein|uniref:peptidase domain-containing ABC transporter n=1 Tax=Microcoleus sp. FACHB-831 TaxID=2692827 RepID=UPI00168733DF|nr:peptidase domain-containing ABC transporter [Microcoleus sp. FACHB-831]MBD1923773.1 peptidase domain-containing ABC transporter [Microcoleus sp. FACHB-831]
MASRENQKNDRQGSTGLNLVDAEVLRSEIIASIPGDEPPFCWLTPQQQVLLKDRASIRRYKLGEKIWSADNPKDQFLVVSGKVRLREEGAVAGAAPASPVVTTLEAGNWFGTLLEYPGQFKAVASSKEVIVVAWDAALWAEVSSAEIDSFWNAQQSTALLALLQPEQPPIDLPAIAINSTPPLPASEEQRPISPPLIPPHQGGEVGREETVQDAKQTTAPANVIRKQGRSPAQNYPFVSSLNTAAACLTMVAQQLQNPASLEWVQRQLRGKRPRDVVEAGEKLGLQLRRLVTSKRDLRQLTFPALLQWQLAAPANGRKPQLEWIVVYEVRGNSLIIADPLNPGQTCEIISQTMLEAGWNGKLWQVEPIQRQEKFNLGWFLPAVWRYRQLLIEVLLASFTLQLLGLATPVITQVIIDKVMVQESLATLDVMAIALLGVSSFEAILGILRLYIFTHTARRLDLSLSAQVFRHLMRLPLAYFESRRVGDTVARVQELENIRQFLTGTALTVILDSIFTVVYLALMFYYNVKLTLVALAVIPLFAILTLVSTPILRNWLNETFNRSADSQSFLVETVTGIHSVKAHAAENTARDRWEGLFARFIRTGFKASTTSNISSNIGDFLTNLSSLLILWFGAKLVIEQKLTIGQLVAFQMLSGRVTGPLLRLVQLWQNLQQVLLSVDRIGDILNVAPEAEPGAGLVLPPLKGEVNFEQVFFRYRPDQEPILRGITFTIQPGMFVGIVGRSGSGKSTLSKLLQRLYQVESGRILIDGFDIKSADLGSLRQQIGVVLQEDFLFNGSILENITLGNPDITAEQVVDAARLAAAHDFISDLTHGYENNVGERGTALSGGQRQRIALARLFLSQAPILVLDEATSALDSETEQQVLQNLQRVSANRTMFMIAHRFEPLKRADLILVLEKGVLMEQGTHQELIQKKGLYWSLYQRQQASM